jgi:hypothetical protein
MSKQKKDLPSYLVPGYKLNKNPNCTCPPGLYCECGSDYRPRDGGRCGVRRTRFPIEISHVKDDGWKYGYLPHRLSAFGPHSWVNGSGEVMIYGPKSGLKAQDLPEPQEYEVLTKEGMSQNKKKKETKKEKFELGYGSGNAAYYNFPVERNYECGFKPFALYG